MGYQALVFCPDEKTARTVTQVLTELDFAVEACTEPFAAVKRLMGQHFDAVVVDCDNEQNATLLFKSARNSSSNQASLAVAVVEGQAGVAKAFRIGANLVLTKPINIERFVWPAACCARASQESPRVRLRLRQLRPRERRQRPWHPSQFWPRNPRPRLLQNQFQSLLRPTLQRPSRWHPRHGPPLQQPNPRPSRRMTIRSISILKNQSRPQHRPKLLPRFRTPKNCRSLRLQPNLLSPLQRMQPAAAPPALQRRPASSTSRRSRRKARRQTLSSNSL